MHRIEKNQENKKSIKIEINNKIKNCFFQRTSELKILSWKLIMKKKTRERTKFNNIRKEWEKIAKPVDIRVISHNYKQLLPYVSEIFEEKHKLSRLIKKLIDNQNGSVSIKGVKTFP